MDYSLCKNTSCELADTCKRNVKHYKDLQVGDYSCFEAAPHMGVCYYFLPLKQELKPILGAWRSE